MIEIIKTQYDLCAGCNRCVRECPMELANISYQDEAGNIKVKIDYEKCIACGRCLSVCKHNARYFEDDTLRFFDDLSRGIPISLIAAPSIRTNIPGYKKLFTCLKQLGVNKIYDVSLGADICIWAYIRHMEKTGNAPLIAQPCPTIVRYCEIYRHNLLKKLSPIHSPMGCVSIYMKEYEGINDRIAALSPCVAKSNEFEETGLAQYNVTFSELLKYIDEHNINIPEEETGYDHYDCSLGSLLPASGGLKENIEFFLGKQLSIDRAEGEQVYKWLDTYAESSEDILPQIYDVLNCFDGCNLGSACTYASNVFEINRQMDKNRRAAIENRDKEFFASLYRSYDDTLDLSRFMREYRTISTHIPRISDEDIEKAFTLLDKTDDAERRLDCGACGSDTCGDMARKIALRVNIPVNCIVKSMEDAKKEHEENLAARNRIAIMEKQREADERMQIMLDANPHINVLFNDRFDVIDCNPVAVKYMGFKTKEELLDGFVERMNKSIPAFQPDGRPSSLITERLMAAAKEGYVKFETELILGGEPCTLNIELKRIPYQNSFAVVAYVFDMTEIHEREMELKRAHELNELQLAKLNLAVQSTKIGLWDMEVVKRDKAGSKNIFTWSDEFRQMLGFSDVSDFPNELYCWSDRLHPEDKSRTFDSFNKHLFDKTGKTLFDMEYRLQKKNGEYAYFHDSCKTIRDEDGNPIRVAGALADITETKNIILDKEKMRIEAEAASKAKSAFLSTMSHEIRTPMNAILGITEIQMQNETLSQNTREAFSKIQASGDMLLGIINDILDLSKIEAGKMELVIARYEIASLISDTAQLNMMRIGSKPIEFELDVDEKTPLYLLGDELRVKQILNNILSNAFKYTAGGTVRLSLCAEAGDVDGSIMLVFKVSDTGQGMTKEQIDKLFDEYSRFNLEANRSTEGTGLGMSITQKLIHMMNGEITIESEPGRGTTFTTRLPQRRIGHEVLGRESVENLHLFRSSSRAQMKRTQIAREPMPYGSVLVVDDVETNIYVARGLLAPYELKVDSAESGFAAIEKIKNGGEYDIVFMDHMMPKMDGIETTKIIRDMGYKRSIVALTANAVSGQADIFLHNGFDDYISKPIDVRQLNAVLNKLIRDKQPPEVIEEARRRAGETKEQHSLSDDSPSHEIDPRFSEIFLRDASRSLAVLDSIQERHGAYSEEDIRTYVIHVHGIKSALANIGKMELSAVALKLEMSARDADTAVMASETAAFLNSLRALMEELKPAKEKVQVETEDEDRPYLREKLLTMKTACESYDKKTARDALAQLKDKTWSQPTEELLDAISEYLLHSDFDEIADAVNKYLQTVS